jgi:hypothetical protein
MTLSKLGACLLALSLLTPVSAFAVAPPAATITIAVASGSAFAVSWNAVSTATHYYLWVTDSSGVVRHQVWYTSAQVGCNTGQPACQRVLNLTLQPGTTYMWVQTWNADGYGAWSPEYRTLAHYSHPRIYDSTGVFLGVLAEESRLMIDYNGVPTMFPVTGNGLFLNGLTLFYAAGACAGTPHTYATFPNRGEGGGSTLYIRTGPTLENFVHASSRDVNPNGTLTACAINNGSIRAQALSVVSVSSVFSTITPPLSVVR